MGRIRVLLADDHPVVREGLESIINSTDDLIVSSKAVDTSGVLQSIRDNPPDILVLDLGIPGGGGMQVLRQLVEGQPPVLILTIQPEAAYGLRCVQAGARGFLNKNSSPDEILLAIRTVATGRVFISDQLKDTLMRSKEQGRLLDRLSRRELEVLNLLVQGMRNKQIASALHISEKTISSHRTHLMEKLNVHSLAALLQVASQEGLIP